MTHFITHGIAMVSQPRLRPSRLGHQLFDREGWIYPTKLQYLTNRKIRCMLLLVNDLCLWCQKTYVIKTSTDDVSCRLLVINLIILVSHPIRRGLDPFRTTTERCGNSKKQGSLLIINMTLEFSNLSICLKHVLVIIVAQL